jgi:hypothetical protein
MSGKTVIRIILILALIVTAHTIKPFSINSVTNHLLYSTRSFKFVLPVRLRDNFDHANYLALSLSNSLFETGKGIQGFVKNSMGDLALAPIKVQPLDEVNKSATKPRTKPKPSAPAKRINRTEKNDTADLIASVNSDEIAPVELPPAPAIDATSVALPVFQPCLTKVFTARAIVAARAQPVEILLALKKNDCQKREAPQNPVIVWIEEARKLRVAALRIAEKSKVEKAAVIASECEDQKTEVVTEELEIEIAEPEEEIIAPQQNEERNLGPLSAPIEECVREP